MFLPLLGLFYGAITADMVSVKNMQISRSVLLNLKKSKINSLRPVDKIWRQNFPPASLLPAVDLHVRQAALVMRNYSAGCLRMPFASRRIDKN